MTDEKPKAPRNGYQQFQQDHRAEVATMPFVEQNKALADKWKEVPETEKKQYQEDYKVANTKYQKDLAAFYEQHPDIKLKDEKEAEAKKEKKNANKEPAGLKADEKNTKIFFFVAYVKKFRDQYKPDYLKATPAVKKQITAVYAKLEENGELGNWQAKWGALKVEDRIQIKKFYEQWLLLKQEK